MTINTEEIDSNTSFPVSIIYKHIDHEIILYVDANYSIRGVETINLNLLTKNQNVYEFKVKDNKINKIISNSNRKIIYLD